MVSTGLRAIREESIRSAQLRPTAATLFRCRFKLHFKAIGGGLTFADFDRRLIHPFAVAVSGP